MCAEDPAQYPDGARWARNVDVWPRERLDEAQRLLRDVDGVTVIVYDQACAAEKRRARKRGKVETPPLHVFINERVCEGCGDCGVKSNCLSVQPVDTEFGRKTRIHQSSCNQDFTCLDGDCPSFVTVTETRRSRRRARARAASGTAAAAARHARSRCIDDDCPTRTPRRARPSTGSSTSTSRAWAARVSSPSARSLATAALLDGYHVAGLDQTGLSQKGGPGRLAREAVDASRSTRRTRSPPARPTRTSASTCSSPPTRATSRSCAPAAASPSRPARSRPGRW